MTIPLNQSYREKVTLETRPEVGKILADYKRWARGTVGWVPYDLHPSLGPPGRVHCGRTWDAALTLASIDFTGLSVLELGARASLLSPYLTRDAALVHVTDLFGRSHHSLGDLPYWANLWYGAASNPDRLRPLAADMRCTGYESNAFDVVICLSAIEHVTVPEDGDTISVVEMTRICKPGGLLVIGTDMSDEFRTSGGHYYDERAIWERLIKPSGCIPYGEMDLSWEGADKSPHKSGAFERTCCLFVLRKPISEED